MEFGRFIELNRGKKYKNPREFYQKSSLSCSYYYYLNVEKGKAIPSIDLAIEMIGALKIDKRQGLFAWARSQMPDSESKTFFADVGEQEDPHVENMPSSKTLVVNRHQAQFLSKNPLAMEVFTFINLRDKKAPITSKKAAESFRSTEKEMRSILKELFEIGLIDMESPDKFTSKEWVLIPFTREYESLNDSIFLRSYQQFKKSNDPKKIRHVATIQLNEAQRRELDSKIKSLVNWVVASSQSASDDAFPYSIGIFGSRRIFGDDK